MPRPKGPSNPEATRRRVLAEAQRLFAAQGFHDTSLAEIARAAGITAPSLLYYFPNKEALCDEVLRITWRRLGDELRPVLASGVGLDEMFDALLRALIVAEARDQELLTALSAAMLTGKEAIAPAVNDTLLPLVADIEQGLRAAEPGRIHPDAPLRQALLYIQLAHGAQQRLTQITGEAPVDRASEAFFVASLLRSVVGWTPSTAPLSTMARNQ